MKVKYLIIVAELKNKTDNDATVSDIENKYIARAVYNKFTKDIVANNVKNKNYVAKSSIAGLNNMLN